MKNFVNMALVEHRDHYRENALMAIDELRLRLDGLEESLKRPSLEISVDFIQKQAGYLFEYVAAFQAVDSVRKSGVQARNEHRRKAKRAPKGSANLRDSRKRRT